MTTKHWSRLPAVAVRLALSAAAAVGALAGPGVASAACTTTFAAVSGNWDDASNWSGGAVPTPVDDVCVQSGSVQLARGYTVRTLTLSGGEISGGGLLPAQGMTWRGGALNTRLFLQRVGATEPIASLEAAELQLGPLGRLEVDGGVLHTPADVRISRPSGGTAIVNTTWTSGVLRKTGSGVLDLTNAFILSSARMSVQEGTLILGDGEALADLAFGSGSISVWSGALIRFAGTAFDLHGASLDGDFVVSGGVRVSDAAFRFGSLVLDGGSIMPRPGADDTARLFVEGRVDWRAGRLGVRTEIASFGRLDLPSQTGSRTLGRVLEVDGLAQWSGGALHVEGPSGMVDIDRLGRLDVTGSATLTGSKSFADLSLSGTLDVDSWAVLDARGARSSIGGVVSPTGGTILFGPGRASRFTPFRGFGEVHFAEGAFDLTEASLGGSLRIVASATVLVERGQLDLRTQLVLDGGSIRGGGSILAHPGAIVEWKSGTLATRTTVAREAHLMFTTGGTRNLEARLTVQGTGFWSGTGQPTHGGTLAASGDGVLAIESSMEVSGAATVTGPPDALEVTGTLTKRQAGVLDLRGVGVAASGSITIFRATGTSGPTSILLGSGRMSGETAFFFADRSTAIEFSGAGEPFDLRGSFFGDGEIRIAGSVSTEGGFVVVDAPLFVRPGASVSGTGTFEAKRTVSWTGGRIAAPFIVGTRLTLPTTSSAPELAATLTVYPGRTVDWSGDLTTAGQAAIHVWGTMKLVSSARVFGAAPMDIFREGRLQLAAPLAVGGVLRNAGTLDVGTRRLTTGSFAQASTGTLSLTIGATASGLVATGPAEIDGSVTANLAAGFTPPPSASFDLLEHADRTGAFSAASVPSPLVLRYGVESIRLVPPDTSPPRTSATRSVEPGADGWNREAVTVTLRAIDDFAGVRELRYDTSGAETVVAGDEASITIEGEGVTTLTFRSVDNFGNVEPPQVLTVRIDTAAPAIACEAADGKWYAANVSRACTAVDPTSGLADAADAAFSLTTSVAEGDESSDAATGSRTVCDVAANCATAGPITGNRVDRKAPVITVASSVIVNAISPGGAPVEFTATAVDGADPAPATSCVPASGNVFAIGVSAVECTTRDAAGNGASASFQVTVKGAVEQLRDLMEKTREMLRLPALPASLHAPLQQALTSLVADKLAACRAMNSFILGVRGLAAIGRLTPTQAEELIVDAARIKRVLAC